MSITLPVYLDSLTGLPSMPSASKSLMVVFDMVGRWLRASGYELKYVRNITDIDDKIIKRSNELNIPYTELTEKFIQAYFEDMDNLNIQRASDYPRATDFIEKMQNIISKLIEKDKFQESQIISEDKGLSLSENQKINIGKFQGDEVLEKLNEIADSTISFGGALIKRLF